MDLMVQQFDICEVWDKKMVHTQFNWCWYHVPTFAPYKVEGIFHPLILGHGRTTQTVKTASIVLQSLTPNAQSVFKVIAEHQLAHPDEEGKSLANFLLFKYVSFRVFFCCIFFPWKILKSSYFLSLVMFDRISFQGINLYCTPVNFCFPWNTDLGEPISRSLVIFRINQSNPSLIHVVLPFFSGMPINNLYTTCREQFLVSSQVTLNSHLTEFKDHELVKMRRHSDGQDCLHIPLAIEAIEKLVLEISQ